ncbi:MAG: TIR domain-containing protein [Jatrophihabitantaceae bacterium]
MTSLTPVPDRRVFLSYAHEDAALVQVIVAALSEAGVTVTNQDPFVATTVDVVQEHLSDALRASDLLIVMVSGAAFQSPWVNWEIEQVVSGKLRKRGVDIIPARLDETPLPSALAHRQAIDFTRDFDGGLRELIRQINASRYLDFKRLTPQAFENLVADLLHTLGFSVDGQRSLSAAEVDIRATRRARDPFGAVESETWLVECKLYGAGGRISVDAIRQMAGFLATAPVSSRGLLVTTAQVTSVAYEYLAEVERTARVRLRVIDGAELSALLRENSELVVRHFVAPEEPDGLG